MITDAQYLSWLANDQVARVVLLEAEYFHDGQIHTLYASNRAYVSGPTDAPANQPYDEYIVHVPLIERVLSGVVTGRARFSVGSIDLINADGSLDAMFTAHVFGRPARLYLGDVAWSRNDFRPVLVGASQAISGKGPSLSLQIADASNKLNKPIQSATISTGPSTGRLKPLCFGTCFNVSPVLLDAGAHSYQVHDGPVTTISAVRVDGGAVAFTPNLAAGTFTLATAANGTVTADVTGASGVGSSAADLIRHIAQNRGGLPNDQLDLDAFAALNALNNAPLNLYISERRNIIDVLDEIAASIGAWWRYDTANRLTVGRLDQPGGTPAVSLVADDIAFGGLSVTGTLEPLGQVRLGYRRNWTPQRDSVGSGANESQRSEYSDSEKLLSKESPSTLAAWPQAERPDARSTLLVNSADADAEATRLLALYSAPRLLLSLTTQSAPWGLSPGDCLHITHSRYGMSDGRLARVLGVRVSLTGGDTVVELML